MKRGTPNHNRNTGNRTWFRFYVSALGNEKLRRLTDREYRLWTFILCAYCERQLMPKLEDLAWKLRISEDQCKRLMNRLTSNEIGLLDAVGDSWAPHDWDDLQFESDSSRERTARYRERLRSASNARNTGLINIDSHHNAVTGDKITKSQCNDVTVTSDSATRSLVTDHSIAETETEQSREKNTPLPPSSPGPKVAQLGGGVLRDEDGFPEFRSLAEQYGMSASEPDWKEARLFEWKPLDFFQRQEAICGIQLRIQAKAFDDPVHKALPVNYLKRKMWQRQIQSSSGSRSSGANQALEVVLAEERSRYGDIQQG